MEKNCNQILYVLLQFIIIKNFHKHGTFFTIVLISTHLPPYGSYRVSRAVLRRARAAGGYILPHSVQAQVNQTRPSLQLLLCGTVLCAWLVLVNLFGPKFLEAKHLR